MERSRSGAFTEPIVMPDLVPFEVEWRTEVVRSSAVAPRTFENVDFEGAAEQSWPVEARGRRVEQALIETIPVASREDVGREALDS